MDTTKRARPNILVTGTPGTGKTTLSERLSSKCGLSHIELSSLIKERSLHSGWNAEFESFELDEDKVCDELEDMLANGGNVVDFHSCDFFPERWFDLVVVLRTDNSVLYPRLEARRYSQKKISENIECEIMQVLLDEARESYKAEIVLELASDTVEHMEQNVAKLEAWVKQWVDRDSEIIG